MTIICAMHEPGVGTWIGSDSQAQGGDLILPYAVSKWALHGRWAIGANGDYRACVVLRHAKQLAECRAPEEVFAAVRQLLIDDGFKPTADEGAIGYSTSVIVAGPDGLWDADSTFAWDPVPARTFISRGSGRQLGYGAAHALSGLPPEKIIRAAIAAACAYDTGCGGEPYIHLIKA